MFKRYRTLFALCVAPVVFAGCNDYNFNAPKHTFDVSPQFKGIGLGETLQLTAIGADGTPVSVSWASDDPNVASVSSSGLVTGAHAGGPVGVIATLSSDPTETQASSITVLKGFTKLIAGATGTDIIYTIDIPAGATKLTVTLTGGTGDADMAIAFNTTPNWHIPPDACESGAAGNAESCVINNPAAGKWYILVNGYEAYAGATLSAIYTSP
jgi:serine protease